MRTASSVAPTAGGTPEAVKMNGREAIRRYSITSADAGDHAAARCERLGKRRHPQVDAILHAEQLAGAGPALPEDAERVRLIDHQPGAVALRQVGDRVQRGDVALHREHAVDDDEHPAAVLLGLLQPVLEQIQPVVAEGAKLRPREDAAVQDRGVVAGSTMTVSAGPRIVPRCRGSPGGPW